MNSFHPAFRFLSYKVRAVNQHGVHSPFVFRLLNNVIYRLDPYYSYESVEALRATLLQNGQVIHCTELGAGSRTGKSQRKTVKQIARQAVKPAKYGQLLFRLVDYFQPQTILELGTSLGLTTSYLAMANRSAKVTSMEGCSELIPIAQKHLDQLEIKNVELIEGNFDDRLPEWLAGISSLDFVYFDGNHRKKPTLEYFHQCLEKANNQSVFVFDDIYWSKPMTEAWEEIKAHPKVSVTIDLYQMGIVFFREGQAKEDFIIRF